MGGHTKIIHRTMKGREFVLEVYNGYLLKLCEWTGKDAWYHAHTLEGQELDNTLLEIGPSRNPAIQKAWETARTRRRIQKRK